MALVTHTILAATETTVTAAQKVDSAADARSRMGGGQCHPEIGYDRYRHYGAPALRQADGMRKSYNPKNKGKKSYQPILSFLAETREFVAGELRNGDRPTGSRLRGIFRKSFSNCLPG